MKSRITPELFNSIKHHTFMHRTQTTANKFGVSIKTVVQVKASKNFEAYTEQNKAQHPPIKNSLRDEVLYLHQITFGDRKDYVLPPTARKAIAELQASVLNS